MTRRTEFPCSRSRSAGVACSFAVVVQQLPNKPTRLQRRGDAVCVFYLVLRALDTVEDDMTLSVETKLPILKTSTSTSRTRELRCPAPGLLPVPAALQLAVTVLDDVFAAALGRACSTLPGLIFRGTRMVQRILEQRRECPQRWL